MPSIVENVHFNTVAREWRCKWNTNESLVNAQKILEKYSSTIKSSTPGLQNVQRIVCGGCHDFKVIISTSAECFGEWEKQSFTPEAEFLNDLKSCDGIDTIETQTYTLETV